VASSSLISSIQKILSSTCWNVWKYKTGKNIEGRSRRKKKFFRSFSHEIEKEIKGDWLKRFSWFFKGFSSPVEMNGSD
jgi:hypothetical protein